MNDPFAITGADFKPVPYPTMLMFAVAHGIRPAYRVRKPVDLDALAATQRSTEAALERVRQQRAITEEYYRQREARVAA